jgi:hypothetical protein
VYSTCVFCNRALGTNESVEHFPVGQRLAFDAAKGRLWAVCPHCHRWNLTPLEERWEAIEDAERLFRSTRLRISTDNIGLARMRDGTDLIRVGAPQRPELAAWRYGSQFATRRRRVIVGSAAAATSIGAMSLLLPAAALPVLIPIAGAGLVVLGVGSITGSKVLFAQRFVRDEADHYLRVTPNDIGAVRLAAEGEGWVLRVPYQSRRPTITPHVLDIINKGSIHEATLRGQLAIDAARALLPLVNGTGAKAQLVSDAVALVADWDSADAAFFLPPAVRLALEMSVHEEQERRALEGELASLEQAWRDAEEVAAIADDLLIPNPVLRALQRLRSLTPP